MRWLVQVSSFATVHSLLGIFVILISSSALTGPVWYYSVEVLSSVQNKKTYAITARNLPRVLWYLIQIVCC